MKDNKYEDSSVLVLLNYNDGVWEFVFCKLPQWVKSELYDFKRYQNIRESD